MIPALLVRKTSGLRKACICLTASAICVFGILAPVTGTLAAKAPGRGDFLVATRDLEGSFFAESVILLIQHDDLGTVGLIINQPSDVGLAAMLPEIRSLVEFDGKLFIGGPVSTYGIMMLVQSDVVPAESQHIFGNVYASGSRELLLDMLNDQAMLSQIRIYAGHAGWFPGQLDSEIARGSWEVLPGDESMVFSVDPLEIWKNLVPPPGRIMVQARQASKIDIQ